MAKMKPYNPVDMEDQHLKNRIRAQMEADHYWKKQMEKQDAYRALKKPFDPLAFRFVISPYARRHHRTKHDLVVMSDYCKQLHKQATAIKAKLTFIRGLF